MSFNAETRSSPATDTDQAGPKQTEPHALLGRVSDCARILSANTGIAQDNGYFSR